MMKRIGLALLLLCSSISSAETVAVIGTGNVGMAIGTEMAGTVAKNLGDLSGKLIIDATNPLDVIGEGPQFDFGVPTSNGQIVQAPHPDAHVVKAFSMRASPSRWWCSC
jgi:predicted dinucleotide-binding enzyme